MSKKRKRGEQRGHYCHLCGRVRPNERFSGKGHKNHVCKDCQRMPKEQRDRIEAFDEMIGFLDQGNISDKNLARLEEWAESAIPEVRNLAEFLHEVALLRPGKRRRLKFLAEHHPALFVKYWRLLPYLDPFVWPEEHGIPPPQSVQQELDLSFDPPFDEDPAEGRTYSSEEMASDEVPFDDEDDDDWGYPIYPLLDDE